MKDYSEVSLVEYMNKKRDMLRSIGCGDDGGCFGTKCNECPIAYGNNKTPFTCDTFEIKCTQEAARIVMEFEPPVDWTKVPVDTKVLVKNEGNWEKRHFTKYQDGVVWCFVNGATSFTADGRIGYWKYAKLYNESEEN